MPQFRIPFSEIPKKPVLPKADYPAMIEKVKKESNSAGDGDNLVWDFRVLDPSVDDGTTLRMWTGITNLRSLWKVEGIMVNLGLAVEGEDMVLDINEETDEVDALAGKPCVIAVSVGKSLDGKRDQNNVDDVFGPNGRPPKVTSNSNGSGPKRPRAR